MVRLEYRTVNSADLNQVNQILVANNVSFDTEFVERILNRNVCKGNLLLGGFEAGNLVAVGGLYSYPAFCFGSPTRGVTWCFAVVDKKMHGRGVGTMMLSKVTSLADARSPSLVVAFIDSKLTRKMSSTHSWLDAAESCWAQAGYAHGKLSTIMPLFRTSRKQPPETAVRELDRGGAQMCDPMSYDRFHLLRCIEDTYSSYCIAENPVEKIEGQLRVSDENYWLFLIEHEGLGVGYVSCMQYLFQKDGKIQRQIHFDNIIVAERYLRFAINSVVERFEKLGFRTDAYVINNSSLLNKGLLRETAFYPGFSKLDVHVWYRENELLDEFFKETHEGVRFSFTVI